MKLVNIGYDIRLLPTEFADSWWSSEDREKFLLKPSVISPLSVDEAIWPSAFVERVQGMQAGDPLANLLHLAKVEQLSPFGLWTSQSELETKFRSSSNLNQRGQIVQASIVLSHFNKVDSWLNKVVKLDAPTTHRDNQESWNFIGYDIADRSLISGLCNCAYDSSQKKQLHTRWGNFLNSHGLFEDDVIASKFRTFSNCRVREHRPFYVFALYCGKIISNSPASMRR